MKHLGDIKNINGSEIEPVDCIIGGSPCQDLSVANGNRKGLAGNRSGLFIEQIRVVKEMRERSKSDGRADEFVQPRFMLWENVPGALSSPPGNKGADFQAVLTECVRVKEENAPDVPIPKGGWSNAGVLMGRGWSIAWKISDLQYFGCPQRRKRLALLCDFNGMAAPEIVFEQYSARSRSKVQIIRQGLSRDSESGKQTWESPSERSGDGSDADDPTG